MDSKKKKITLIGITHIDTESPERVKKLLTEIKPDAVCLELDYYRLSHLLATSQNDDLAKDIPRGEDSITFNGDDKNQGSIQDSPPFGEEYLERPPAILEGIGLFEEELARIARVDYPGMEMLQAYHQAKKQGAEVYLIDKSIHDISKAMALELSEEESLKFQELVDELLLEEKIVAKPISREIVGESFIIDQPGEEREKKKEEERKGINNENDEINLNEVFVLFQNQEVLNSILTIFKQNFPKLYSILLEDRDMYMAREVLKVTRKHSNIVVVLGHGHITAISQLLKPYSNEIDVRLAK